VQDGSLKTIKLVVSYDGTRFKGWQRGNGRTVQDVLEDALRASLGTASRGAAEGQVASAAVPASVDVGLLLTALNDRLPPDLSVLSAVLAADRFHARYLATAKTYRYRIVDGDAPNPFLHRFSWFVRGRLDEGAMREAAAALEGEHDFTSFTADKGKKDKVRTVYGIAFSRPSLFGGRPLDISFRGDGFLWNQVRVMAAALALAGQGKLAPDDIRKLLSARDRSLAPPPAPAAGLTLVSVEYADA
jgi:tRNA pseudouridine38-40 synthase